MTADHTPGRERRLIPTALYNSRDPGPVDEDEIEAGAAIETRDMDRRIEEKTYKGLVAFLRRTGHSLPDLKKAHAEIEQSKGDEGSKPE